MDYGICARPTGQNVHTMHFDNTRHITQVLWNQAKTVFPESRFIPV